MINTTISRRYFLTAGIGSLITSRFLLVSGVSLFVPIRSIFAEVDFPDPDSIRTLFRIVRILYPHNGLSDVHYEVVVKSLVQESLENDSTRQLLSTGFAVISEKSAGAWPDPNDEQLSGIIRDIAGSEFIAKIKTATILKLYDNHTVWQTFGYEGEAFSKGGYIDRGFNDLDWLPAPPPEASPVYTRKGS